MKIEATKRGDAVVIKMMGEITDRDDQTASAELLDAKLAEGERLFVLDLSLVPFVSSLGIAVLVRTRAKVQQAGGVLRLVNPKPSVARVLELTKVADIFKTYSSVEEALSEA